MIEMKPTTVVWIPGLLYDLIPRASITIGMLGQCYQDNPAICGVSLLVLIYGTAVVFMRGRL